MDSRCGGYPVCHLSVCGPKNDGGERNKQSRKPSSIFYIGSHFNLDATTTTTIPITEPGILGMAQTFGCMESVPLGLFLSCSTGTLRWLDDGGGGPLAEGGGCVCGDDYHAGVGRFTQS